MNTARVVGLDIGGRSIKYTVLNPTENKYQATGGIVHSLYMELELEQIFKRLAARILEDISCVGVIMSYPLSCGDYLKGVQRIVPLFSSLTMKVVCGLYKMLCLPIQHGLLCQTFLDQHF
jgi:hypothetical protein